MNETGSDDPRIVLEGFADGSETDRILSTLEAAGIRREAIHVE
ncbi:hypothetical protein [Natrinema saccharevitans]|nr:hypothetical protein [Natrinema saccharevitans]